MAPALTTETAEQVSAAKVENVKQASTSQHDKFFEDVHFIGDKEGKVVIRSPPVFETKLEEQTYQKQHLAAAYRVFAKQGFDEGTAGHISLRDPINPDHFWINPLSMHFAQIKVSDLVLVDEEGHVLPGGAQHPINRPAFAIHSEIHKARPDLNAACHAHSVYGKAWSCFGKLLEPLYQDAIRFYDDLSLYDAYGGTVVSTEEGRRIAEALGPKNRNVILRNHGIITCGSTVDEAAFLFMSLDRCCHSQLLIDAAAAGAGSDKIYIDEETARVTHAKGGNPSKMWLAFQPYYDLAVQEDPNLLN